MGSPPFGDIKTLQAPNYFGNFFPKTNLRVKLGGFSENTGGCMKRYLVETGKKIVLADRDPGDTGAFDGGKEKGLKVLQE